MNAPTPPLLDEHILTLIRLAVREDLGDPTAALHGDKTVELSIPPDLRVRSRIVARSPGIISGTFLLPAILAEYGITDASAVRILAADGTCVSGGETIAELGNSARRLLSAERVLLNFMSRLSGVATLTRRFVDAVAAVAEKNGGRPAICDTRKTTPGFRVLEKYAVRCGGGVNHRIGLYDGVMLKDNHLAALQMGASDQTLAALTAHIRAWLDKRIVLWLEVDTLDQVAEALGGGADIILLDNFTPEQMHEAVRLRDASQSKLEDQKAKTLLEASGGVTLDNVLAVARSGVDRISIGALTHSAPTLDLSMEFQA